MVPTPDHARTSAALTHGYSTARVPTRNFFALFSGYAKLELEPI